jgi:hypothetical protein
LDAHFSRLLAICSIAALFSLRQDANISAPGTLCSTTLRQRRDCSASSYSFGLSSRTLERSSIVGQIQLKRSMEDGCEKTRMTESNSPATNSWLMRCLWAAWVLLAQFCPVVVALKGILKKEA